jgi:hypothetical protein
VPLVAHHVAAAALAHARAVPVAVLQHLPIVRARPRAEPRVAREAVLRHAPRAPVHARVVPSSVTNREALRVSDRFATAAAAAFPSAAAAARLAADEPLPVDIACACPAARVSAWHAYACTNE